MDSTSWCFQHEKAYKWSGMISKNVWMDAFSLINIQTPRFGIYLCIYHLSIYFLKYDSNLLMYIFWSKQNLRLDIHLNRKVLAVTQSVKCIYLQWLFHTNYVILPEFTVSGSKLKSQSWAQNITLTIPTSPASLRRNCIRKTYSCTWTYNFSKIFNKTYFIIIVLLDELCYEVIQDSQS